MKLIALTAAGLLAAAALTPVPAAAQYHRSWDGYHRSWHDRGWDGRRWDRRRHWDDRRYWHRGPRYRYRGGWHHRRSYVTCRWVRGYYGPHRRCFRVWR
ncbi:hypothetical protein LZK98_10690 [Sphingomonas cannabina]|uniref:hypothetical protein n=1 Tax=Sphingomonas cannabina TaxID=2899123 RepID=UPI001F445769|nr:hypothetical protein [Sphingomonas cannabina]UIJ43567.1 hypothetical protein LZK98_10690 [Sphingomonas cannabina]